MDNQPPLKATRNKEQALTVSFSIAGEKSLSSELKMKSGGSSGYKLLKITSPEMEGTKNQDSVMAMNRFL